MGIKKKKMPAYEVTYECDECRKGNMEAYKVNGFSVRSGNLFLHECTGCGKWVHLDKKYPFKI